MAGGLAWMGRSRRAIGAWCALAVVLALKTRLEEALLSERFAGYEDYKRRTPRFIPRIHW
jgi:protein-S-isoprenylcysteine O-methyltransferase Ste14